jgi:hypothetical protein
MSRILAALAVATAFGAALVYGGRAMGAWEPYKPVPDKAGTRLGAPAAGAAKRAKAQRKGARPARTATRGGAETWAVRANAVCRRARPELEVLARELGAARSLADLEAGFAALERMNRSVNAKLKAIPAPPRQRARVRELHRLLAADERLVAAMFAAVRRGDPVALQSSMESADALVKKENELFWELNANECTVAAYLGDVGALA